MSLASLLILIVNRQVQKPILYCVIMTLEKFRSHVFMRSWDERVITSGEPRRLAIGLAEGESNLESVVELRNDKYSLQP